MLPPISGVSPCPPAAPQHRERRLSTLRLTSSRLFVSAHLASLFAIGFSPPSRAFLDHLSSSSLPSSSSFALRLCVPQSATRRQSSSARINRTGRSPDDLDGSTDSATRNRSSVSRARARALSASPPALVAHRRRFIPPARIGHRRSGASLAPRTPQRREMTPITMRAASHPSRSS